MHVDLFRSTDEQIRVVIPSSLWPHKHLVATLLLHGTHQGNTPLHGASPWLGGKESACQCRFRSCMGKSPWRRKRQTTTVFLLEKSHGQRSLVGYTVHGVVRVGHDLATKQQQAPYILGCWGPECRAQALCLLSYEQQQFVSLNPPKTFSSAQFTCSDMSDSLQPHGLHHARPLCPSPTPGVYSNSCPLNW